MAGAAVAGLALAAHLGPAAAAPLAFNPAPPGGPAAGARAPAFRTAQLLGPTEVEAGQEGPGGAGALYGQLCAACHGAEGKGNGPAAVTMAVKPRDHTDAAYMGGLTDGQIFDVINRGGAAVGKFPGMPAWGQALSERQIWDLVRYIRSLNMARR